MVPTNCGSSRMSEHLKPEPYHWSKEHLLLPFSCATHYEKMSRQHSVDVVRGSKNCLSSACSEMLELPAEATPFGMVYDFLWRPLLHVPYEILGGLGASSSLDTTKQAGNKKQSPKFPKPLRLSQRDVSDSTRTADVTMGTEESARLARLRYDQGAENKVTWDIDCLTCIAAFIRRRVLMLHNNHDNGAKTDGNEDEDDAGRNGRRVRRENSMSRVQQDFLAQKVHRRPLSMEQQEMLRCIGLDAFMTLRFLEFGFDVSFWPFLFSLITLVPTFVTGDNDQVGYYRSTALNLPLESERHWAVVVFGIFHFIYILRRIWIEWEIFLPLRYDFLENGDFDKSKHQDQYRHTCLVEYVPRSHKHDQDVFKFFDAIFPGQVKRAEVLLNTYEMICVGFMFV